MSYMPHMRAKPGETRCEARYDGIDRVWQCEYRQHRGAVHAASTGAVQWREIARAAKRPLERWPAHELVVETLPGTGVRTLACVCGGWERGPYGPDESTSIGEALFEQHRDALEGAA